MEGGHQVFTAGAMASVIFTPMMQEVLSIVLVGMANTLLSEFQEFCRVVMI